MSKLRPNILIALVIAIFSLTALLRPLVANVEMSDRLLLALALTFSAITFYVVVDRMNNHISKRKGAVFLLITGILYGLIMSILEISLKSAPQAFQLAIGLLITTPAILIVKSITDATNTTEKEQHHV